MSASNASGAHVSHLEALLSGVHEANRVYVSNRLCRSIDGLLSCRFVNDDNNEVKLSFDTRRLDRFALLTAIQRA